MYIRIVVADLMHNLEPVVLIYRGFDRNVDYENVRVLPALSLLLISYFSCGEGGVS
jgi:hypothetical protein